MLDLKDPNVRIGARVRANRDSSVNGTYVKGDVGIIVRFDGDYAIYIKFNDQEKWLHIHHAGSPAFYTFSRSLDLVVSDAHFLFT